MATYVTADNIKRRLLGKVRFTNDETDENAVSNSLLDELIVEAEAEVENRLSIRYQIPFVSEANEGAFNTLPATTQAQILALIRMAATKRILDLDFGKGSAVTGEEYEKMLRKDYEERMERLVERREGCFNLFKYPPLPGLRLASHNSESDDGYVGTIMVTSDDYGDYAAPQTPDPGETIWNGSIRDVN
jgi:hypothetical protein